MRRKRLGLEDRRDLCSRAILDVNHMEDDYSSPNCHGRASYAAVISTSSPS